MEPITHLLTGACISRAGFNRTSALATATLVVAAEIPDIDVLAYFGGPVSGFAHHRGFTHTFLGVPCDAALALGLVWLWQRLWKRAPNPVPRDGPHPEAWQRPRWGLLFWYGCLGVLSHILLDFTNNYGVRPLAPFSWRWFSWDIIFIIEPVLLAALLLGLALPWLFRMIQEEIGAPSRRKLPRGRSSAITALVFIACWAGFRDFEHRGAMAAMTARLYEGAEPVRLSAYPYWINPFQWHGVVETQDFFEMVPVNSRTGEVDAEGQARIRYKPQETAVTLAAKKSYLGRVYLDWAQYPLIQTEQHDNPRDAFSVQFFDLRFAYPERERPSLAASVELDRDLKVVAERFEGRGKNK